MNGQQNLGVRNPQQQHSEYAKAAQDTQQLRKGSLSQLTQRLHAIGHGLTDVHHGLSDSLDGLMGAAPESNLTGTAYPPTENFELGRLIDAAQRLEGVMQLLMGDAERLRQL